MAELVRTFIAVEIPPSVQQELARIQERLKQGRLPVRWVAPEKVHLTLKFLGEISPEQVTAVGEATARVAADSQPFDLEAVGIGVFPNVRRPRVVWVGVEGDLGVLRRLQAYLETALAGLGFSPERRPFSAHLTMGRVRRRTSPGDARHVGEVVTGLQVSSLGRWRVDEIVVVRSDLRPTGPIYTPQRVASLGTAP
jgi:2'-5' RNA ligase